MPFRNPHPLYVVWQSMRHRCHNSNYRQWADYGGRGIAICKRWDSFAAFVEDMGPRPNGYFIDRIDNDGNYEPSNCRWVSRRESQSNRRITKRITRDGKTYLLSDLARESGLKPDTIWSRSEKGLSLVEIMSPEKRHNLAGLSLGRAARATECPNGHALTPDTSQLIGWGRRKCLICDGGA